MNDAVVGGPLASLDGEITPASEAMIPATDHGLIRGDGAFEVIRVYEGHPFMLEAHLERLARSAAGLRLALDVESVRVEAYRLLAAAGAGTEPGHELLRIVVTRGGRRLLMTEPLPTIAPSVRLCSVVYAPTRVLDGIKSLSYAANMLAQRLAVERGFDDALLVSPHGRVLEAPTSSFFWVSPGGDLLTPPLSDHILDSITRRIVVQDAGARELVCTLGDLVSASEAFIVGTPREVQPVAAVDAMEFGLGGPVTARAAAAVRARVIAERDAG